MTLLKLSVYRGSERVGEQSFDREIIKIGRLASAHLRLDDSKVSRIHAVIEASSDGSQYSIIDMGSTEGTYKNGEKISKEILRDKDELKVGDFRIVVSFEDAARVSTNDLIASSPTYPQPSTMPQVMPAPGQGIQAQIPQGQVQLPGQIPPAPGEPQGRRSTSELWTATPQELAAASATTNLSAMSPLASEADGGYGRTASGAYPQVAFGLPPQGAMPGQAPYAAMASQPYPMPSAVPIPSAVPTPSAVPMGSTLPPAMHVPSGMPAMAMPVFPQGAVPGSIPQGPGMAQGPGMPVSMFGHPQPGVMSPEAQAQAHAQAAQYPYQYPPQYQSQPSVGAQISSLPSQGQGVGVSPGSVLPSSAPPRSDNGRRTDVASPSGFASSTRPAVPFDPWGSVPSNLASESVADSERALEIKTIWGFNTVVDTLTVTTQPQVTLGDERKVTGFGPFQKVVRCDVEIPSKGLPSKTFLLAEHQGGQGSSYTIHIPATFQGRLERADGSSYDLDALSKGARGAMRDGAGIAYPLQAAETLFLSHDDLTFQIRYVRRAKLLPLGIFDSVNYTWLNSLILAFFIHVVAIASFLATPRTQVDLTDDIFKNPNRFAQFRLTPEEKKKLKSNDMLSKLKAGEMGAKAKGAEGKAGRPDYDKNKKQGRMAIKGDPNKQELAKSTLAKLFGKGGTTGRSYLFGSGGLGGELKGALGGVTGAEIGDATGLGGLGTRGTGPGGGGLSMDSVGLGALGTHGRGGGGSGYGEGIGGLGKKMDRDINISAGSPLVMGSLDKEIIRRVIKQHIAQIRYCYEKELVRAPGLFGKVATKFVISAEGTVQSAEVTESTLGNGEVERCVVSKIRTWQFPKPKGGGIVVVKYPFIFKTTG